MEAIEDSDGEDEPMENEIRFKSHLHQPLVWESSLSFVIIVTGIIIISTLVWFAHHSWTTMPAFGEGEFYLRS